MRQPKAPLQESKGDGQVDGGTPHGPGLHEPLQTKGNVADIDQSGSAAISQSANDEIKEAEEVIEHLSHFHLHHKVVPEILWMKLFLFRTKISAPDQTGLKRKSPCRRAEGYLFCRGNIVNVNHPSGSEISSQSGDLKEKKAKEVVDNIHTSSRPPSHNCSNTTPWCLKGFGTNQTLFFNETSSDRRSVTDHAQV